MKTQLEIIKEKKKCISPDYYVAAFKDGSVSEWLDMSSVPHPNEGDYVRIFKRDTDSDIETKLGSMI
jgi:hypothetical protein